MSEAKTCLGAGYNEDDFAQIEGEMRELTVTITLCEYRNLIREQLNTEHEIEKLNSEIDNLKKSNEFMKHTILSQDPNFFANIASGINKAFQKEGVGIESNDEEN